MLQLQCDISNLIEISGFLLLQGWGWNSGQSSPTSSKDFKKLVVIRMAGTGAAAAVGTGHSDDKMESPTG